jgi:uncharacterized membrane protein YccC
MASKRVAHDRRRKTAEERLAYDLHARLSRSQWSVVQLVAEQHDIAVGAAVRHIIESWAEGLRDQDGRTLLEAAGEIHDPEATARTAAALLKLAQQQRGADDQVDELDAAPARETNS